MTTSHGVIDAPPGEDDGGNPPESQRAPEAARREWWDRLEYWVGVAYGELFRKVVVPKR